MALLLIGGIFGTYAFGIAGDTRDQIALAEVAAGAWLSSICWVELLEPVDVTPPVNPAGVSLDFVVPVYPPEPPVPLVFPPDCADVSSPAWGRDVIGPPAFV